MFIASILEICWAMLLKAADSIGLWLLAFALIALTSVFVLRANRHLPVGTVYAAFTGIGTGGAVVVGIFLFGEPVSVAKIAFICLLLSGVLGLKLITDRDKTATVQATDTHNNGSDTTGAHEEETD